MENLKRLASAVDQDRSVDPTENDSEKKIRYEEIDDCRNTEGFVSGVPFTPSEVLLRLNQGSDGKVDCYTEEDFEWFKQHPERNFMNVPFSADEKIKIQDVLTDLRLKQPVISPDAKEYTLSIQSLFQNLPSDRQADLHASKILFHKMIDNLKKHTTLKELNFTTTDFHDNDLKRIFEAIGVNKSIVHLHVKISKTIPLQFIAQTIQMKRNLKVLEIMQRPQWVKTELDDRYDEFLDNIFKSLESKSCKVTSLHLNRLNLSKTETIKSLCEAIESKEKNEGVNANVIPTPFVIIHLPGCRIKGDGFKYLGQMLRTNKHLLSLNVENNYDGPNLFYFGNASQEELEAFQKQSEQYFNGLSFIFDSLSSDNTTLQSLNVNDCNLFHDPITERMTTALKTSKLETLYMNQNQYTGVIFPHPLLCQKIMKSLETNQHLKTLSFWDARLTNKDFESIVLMLSKNNVLEHINVYSKSSTGSITDAVANMLYQVLRSKFNNSARPPSLQYAVFNFRLVSKDVLKPIVDQFENNLFIYDEFDFDDEEDDANVEDLEDEDSQPYSLCAFINNFRTDIRKYI